MTRISTTPAPIRKPDSVLFGELAIAAGMTGNPVAVCFSESAPVRGEQCTFTARSTFRSVTQNQYRNRHIFE